MVVGAAAGAVARAGAGEEGVTGVGVRRGVEGGPKGGGWAAAEGVRRPVVWGQEVGEGVRVVVEVAAVAGVGQGGEGREEGAGEGVREVGAEAALGASIRGMVEPSLLHQRNKGIRI